MGNGVNKLRYAYYSSFHFYYFLGGVIGLGVALLFVALYARYVFVPFPIIAILSGGVGTALTLLVLKTFLCMDRRPFFHAGIFGGIIALAAAEGGLLWVMYAYDIGFLAMSAGMLAFLVGFVVLELAVTKRIKIYPDRVTIGKLVLYYRDMKVVKWGVGSLERTKQELTSEQQSKPLIVLTPLLFESRGKTFSISYYYAVIEMPEKIFVVQPVFWRNSLAQNLRNGWLETWRWNGSTEPPAGWVRPE